MSDRIFLDSNVVIYCYTNTDFKKQTIARNLVLSKNVLISAQVLQETINVLHRKYNVPWKDLYDVITDFEKNFTVHGISANSIRKACFIAEKYLYSFYDSLIIARAIECDCNILYSEDLNHSQVIENCIQILNPFI